MSNPLATYIYDSIDTHRKEIMNKISKWHVMIDSQRIEMETFDKRKISIHGFTYNETVAHLYWNSFDPFIKEYISHKAEEIRKKAIEDCVDAQSCLELFRKNMYNTIQEIYTKIAKTDRLMRGNGYPDTVKLHPVDKEIHLLCQYVDAKVNAQINIIKKQKKKKITNFVMEHINWLISIILITLSILCEKLGWFSVREWIKMFLEKI